MIIQTHLVVTLRKKVPDEPTAKALLELIKTRFVDQPEIKVSGHTTIHYMEEGQIP